MGQQGTHNNRALSSPRNPTTGSQYLAQAAPANAAKQPQQAKAHPLAAGCLACHHTHPDNQAGQQHPSPLPTPAQTGTPGDECHLPDQHQGRQQHQDAATNPVLPDPPATPHLESSCPTTAGPLLNAPGHLPYTAWPSATMAPHQTQTQARVHPATVRNGPPVPPPPTPVLRGPRTCPAHVHKRSGRGALRGPRNTKSQASQPRPPGPGRDRNVLRAPKRAAMHCPRVQHGGRCPRTPT
jgi:hypothetical protein